MANLVVGCVSVQVTIDQSMSQSELVGNLLKMRHQPHKSQVLNQVA